MNGGETDVTPKISALNIYICMYTYIYIYIYIFARLILRFGSEENKPRNRRLFYQFLIWRKLHANGNQL